MPAVDKASADLAAQAYRDNVSPRMARLDKLERFSRGEQYEGRENFFSDRAALLDRAPCVVYDLVDQAVRSHASMVLGEGRFPEVTSHADEDGSELDERFGLSKEDSAVLDPFVKACARKARLRPTARRLLEAALRCGTAVAVPQVVRGQLRVEALPAKRCVPTFRDDDPEADLLKLEHRYPYVQEVYDPERRRVECVALLYRRVVDDRYDTVYKPVRANRGGAEPPWSVQSRVEHGLGFCPAVWYRACAEDATRADVDGRALHKNLLDELYALDLSRSQVHRGVISTLDPILAELGVEPGFQPAPQVDGPRLDVAGDPLRAWQSGPSRPPWQARGRKRAPGMAYQYPVGADVKLLTLPGDCFKAGFDNVTELKSAICSALHWVPNDPEQTTQGKSAGPMSGKAREWIYRKQTEFDDELRCDFGDRCLLRLVDLVLRVVLAASRRGDVRVPGVKLVVPVLERFEAQEETGRGEETAPVWVPPEFDLVWPPYFEASDDDQKLVADTVRADLAAKLITRRTAVAKVAPWYGISDPAAYADELAEEAQEEAAALHEANALLAGGGESGPEGGKTPGAERPGEGPAQPAGGAPSGPALSIPQNPPDGSTSIRQGSGGAAAQVRAQLAPDFPPDALAWVDRATWEGPVQVPLSRIDFARADTWSATDDPAKVAKFTRKIQAGKLKPLVLVRKPGSQKLTVADGHHRALAYRQLGAETAPAFVATVEQAAGPWDVMHAAQKKAPGRESSGPRGETPAPGTPARGPSSPAGASSGSRAIPTRRKPRAPAYEAAGGLLG